MRSAAHTDHMNAGLGCLCRVLDHMEWGLKQMHRIWVFTCWKGLVQLCRCCVSELTEEYERCIKLWGGCSVLVAEVLLISLCLSNKSWWWFGCSCLFYCLLAEFSSIRLAKGIFPLWVVWSSGDILDGNCRGLNGHRGSFVLPKEPMVNWFTTVYQTHGLKSKPATSCLRDKKQITFLLIIIKDGEWKIFLIKRCIV